MDAPRLDGLSPHLRALAERGQLRRYPRGTVLIHEGDLGGSLFILIEGRLRVYGSSAVADRDITYGYCEPGDYVGEMSLDGGERSASVAALEPCVCALVPREVLVAYLGEAPEFALELLTKVIRRVRNITAKLKSLALNDVYGRLKAALDTDAIEQPDGSRLVPGQRTHRDWAALIGCSREMVSRIMKDLERGEHVLPQPEGLRLPKPLPTRW